MMKFKEKDDVDPFFYDPEAEEEYQYWESRGNLRERYEVYASMVDEPLSFDEWLNN